MPTSAVPGAFTSHAHKREALISVEIVTNGPSCLEGEVGAGFEPLVTALPQE